MEGVRGGLERAVEGVRGGLEREGKRGASAFLVAVEETSPSVNLLIVSLNENPILLLTSTFLLNFLCLRFVLLHSMRLSVNCKDSL